MREIDRHLEEGLDQRVGERLCAFRSSMPPDLEVLGLERLNDLNESSRGLLMILRAELAYCVKHEKRGTGRDGTSDRLRSCRPSIEAAIAEVLAAKAEAMRVRSMRLKGVPARKAFEVPEGIEELAFASARALRAKSIVRSR